MIVFFAAGVFASSWLFLDSFFYFYFGLFLVFLSVVLLVVFWAVSATAGFNPISLFLCAFGAGMTWCSFFYFDPVDSVLQKNIGEKISITGIVAGEIDEREDYSRVILETSRGEKILIMAHRYPVFHYGDEITANGKLEKQEKIDSFDWPSYLAKDGIYFEMFYPRIDLVGSGRGNRLKERLFALKENFVSNISKVIPEPQSSLLNGILFGAKRSMPASLAEDFRGSGLSHIVVLSGYNMTVVADAVMRSLFFLPSFLGMALSVAGIILFAIMTGASATIVRAAIMAILVIVARASGRVYEASIALFAAAFFMVLHNPRILRFDASFQLSFLATFSLIYLSPFLEKYLKFLPEKFNIRQITSSTLSAQIFVFPLLVYKTGLFSAMSLPANMLVLFFIPATMFFGFLAAVSGFVSYYISLFFGLIVYFFLDYEIRVAEFFASFNFSVFEISYFPAFAVAMIYVFYAVFIVKIKRDGKNIIG